MALLLVASAVALPFAGLGAFVLRAGGTETVDTGRRVVSCSSGLELPFDDVATTVVLRKDEAAT